MHLKLLPGVWHSNKEQLIWHWIPLYSLTQINSDGKFSDFNKKQY